MDNVMAAAVGMLPIFLASIAMVVAVGGGFCALCMGFGTPYDPNAPKLALARAGTGGQTAVEYEGSHPAPNYAGIFGTLMALTLITVILSRIDLGGAGNTSLAMAVAAFKASLVALYFMHLKYEKWLMFSLIAIPLFFFAALFFGLMPDLVTNNYSTEKNERPGFGVGIDSIK